MQSTLRLSTQARVLLAKHCIKKTTIAKLVAEKIFDEQKTVLTNIKEHHGFIFKRQE